MDTKGATKVADSFIDRIRMIRIHQNDLQRQRL